MNARPRLRPNVVARLALVLLPIVTGCAAQQGVISGRVRLAAATRGGLPMPPGVAHDSRGTVVYVESPGDTLRPAVPAELLSASMAILSHPTRFAPPVVAVPAGGALEFRNRDRVFHRLFGRAGADSFDTGPIRPGGARRVRMRVPDRFPIFCLLHSQELGIVMVAPTRVVAVAGRNGRFRLPALPLGHYEVHAWHPAYGEVHVPVDLRTRHGTIVLLEF